jgi:KaiC/GvpD/RAD55 family RecA-like ATPase
MARSDADNIRHDTEVVKKLGTIDITPDVLKTEEGRKRVNAAMNMLDNAVSSIVRIVTENRDTILDALLARDDDQTGRDDTATELRDALQRHKDATETFLRAMSNQSEV